MEERAIAVRRLSDLGKANDLVLIRRAVQDPAPAVRAEAAAALGRRREQAAAALLAEMLRGPDEAGPARAAPAVAGIRGPEAPPPLGGPSRARGRTIPPAHRPRLWDARRVPPARGRRGGGGGGAALRARRGGWGAVEGGGGTASGGGWPPAPRGGRRWRPRGGGDPGGVAGSRGGSKASPGRGARLESWARLGKR